MSDREHKGALNPKHCRVFDKEHKGTLSPDELRQILSNLGEVMELPEVDEYIVEADLKAPHLKPDGTEPSSLTLKLWNSLAPRAGRYRTLILDTKATE